MRLIIIIILFLIFSNAQAEVKPTYKQSVDPSLQISAMLFSPNGKKIFLLKYFTGGTVHQYNLNVAFDISSLDTASEVTLDINAGSDDLLADTSGAQGMSFNSDGTKLFINDEKGNMNVHSLSTPYFKFYPGH